MEFIDCYIDKDNRILTKRKSWFDVSALMPEIILTEEEAEIRDLKIDPSKDKLTAGRYKVAWCKSADGHTVVISIKK